MGALGTGPVLKPDKAEARRNGEASPASETPKALLEVAGLITEFVTRNSVIRASDNVSIRVMAGRTLGIVGESGSGKSVLCRAILRLIRTPPGRIPAGKIWFQGRDLLRFSEQEMQRIRGTQIGMVFQNPMTSLDPVWPIGDQITEGLHIHFGLKGQELRNAGVDLLRLVGIPSPETRIHEYPHQWSGGMLQRAVVAMAMAAKPKLLLADEPTTALDVTIQDQILALLLELQEEIGMGLILVSHDMAIIAETCDEVAVMYAGQVVESAPVELIFNEPKHPYTLGLMQCIPHMGVEAKRLSSIPGKPPDLAQRIEGCPFAVRCPYRLGECDQTRPVLRQVGPDHQSACLFPERVGRSGG